SLCRPRRAVGFVARAREVRASRCFWDWRDGRAAARLVRASCLCLLRVTSLAGWGCELSCGKLLRRRCGCGVDATWEQELRLTPGKKRRRPQTGSRSQIQDEC